MQYLRATMTLQLQHILTGERGGGFEINRDARIQRHALIIKEACKVSPARFDLDIQDVVSNCFAIWARNPNNTNAANARRRRNRTNCVCSRCMWGLVGHGDSVIKNCGLTLTICRILKREYCWFHKSHHKKKATL